MLLRISAIDCGVAAGPAKYTAGSPGSTRVSRNVTMITPIRVGMTVARRLRITMAFDLFAAASTLHDRAVVELAMEPVDVAGDVLLRGHVEERLEQRYPRHLGIGF